MPEEGVIGIWPRHTLVDGTETTQPEFSFWFRDVGWGIENYGTDPQIEVDNAPQDSAAVAKSDLRDPESRRPAPIFRLQTADKMPPQP